MPERLRLYLDQMLNLKVAEVLRDEGYDVVRASEIGQYRADDYEILQKAIAENRILITLDDDFGDWAILPLSRHSGVIRLKVNPTTSKNILELIVPFLKLHSQEEFGNQLVILSPNRAKWINTG